MKHHTLGDLTPQDNGQRPTKPRAECERFAAGYKMCMDEMARLGAERDAARAECERLRAMLDGARERIESALDVELAAEHDAWRHGYPSKKAEELAKRWADGMYRGVAIARTALDAGEK